MENLIQRMAGTISILFLLAGCVTERNPVVSTVPSALQQIESDAEDAYDHALAESFDVIAEDAATIASGWQSFRAQASDDGAMEEDLTAMDAAVSGFQAVAATSTDALTLARAANAVSEHMDELFALYESPLPPEILTLDYLGREIVLDAREGDFAAATSHVDELESVYSTIRPELVADGGASVAGEYDASISSMRADLTAEDAEALERDANDGLELVDGMEGVFENAAEVEGGEEAD